MKRFLSAVLAITLLLGALTACNGFPINNTDSITTETGESTVHETSSVNETTSEPVTEEPEVIPEIPEHQTLTELSKFDAQVFPV